MQKEKEQLYGNAGALTGIFTFVSGMGSACSGTASNPWVQAVGVAIIIGSIIFGIAQYLA